MTGLEVFVAAGAVLMVAVSLFCIAYVVWKTGAHLWRDYHEKKRRPGYLLDRPRLGINPTKRRGR